MSKPNIFFKIIRFVGPGAKTYKRPYYQNGYYLKYITRDDACCKHNLTNEQLASIQSKIKNPKVYKKTIENLTKQTNNTGLWNAQGHLTKNEKSFLEEKLKTLDKNQMFWDCVISFKEDFANKFELFTPNKMQSLVKANVNKFFADNNMDASNMEWFFTFHTNTDNPHIHLGFFEKAPKIYNKQKQSYEYKRKGAIPISNLKESAFKMETYLEQTIDYQELQLQRANVTTQFKVAWTDAKQIYLDINHIHNPINAKLQELVRLTTKKPQFNWNKPYYYQQTPFIKTKLNEFSDLLIKNNPSLKTEFDSLQQTLTNYQQLLMEKGKPYQTQFQDKTTNELKTILPWTNFQQEQLYGKDGLYSRIGNEILKTIKQLPKINRPKFHLPHQPFTPYSINYFKPNLLQNLIKKVNHQFWQADQDSYIKFKRLQAMQINELTNK